jgi:peptidoglycan-associated lipoprotein
MIGDRGAAQAAVIAAASAATLLLAGCENLPKLRMPTIASPPPCADFTISIYFEAGSAVITREAQALIHSAGARAKRCLVSGVDVVGLSSPTGETATNLQVSKDRAAAVTAALSASGFEHVDINATAVGDAGAATAKGELRPMRRRATVTFRLVAKT